MLGRLLIAAVAGPVAALVLFAFSWVFERLVAFGAFVEGVMGTGVSLAAVWLVLSGVAYACLYGFQARKP